MKLVHFIDRMRLKNKNFTLLTNNCLGAFLYQNLGIKYLSPTIGINIEPLDFLKFCANLDYYLSLEPEEIDKPDNTWFTSIGGGKIKFPVAKLGDIKIYFQHAENFEHAKNDWNRRKQRINKDNIFVVLLDVNPSVEVIEEFKKLNYKKKLYMYFKGDYDLENSFKIKNLNYAKKTWFSKMKTLKGIVFQKAYYEQYDFVKWLGDKNET